MITIYGLNKEAFNDVTFRLTSRWYAWYAEDEGDTLIVRLSENAILKVNGNTVKIDLAGNFETIERVEFNQIIIE